MPNLQDLGAAFEEARVLGLEMQDLQRVALVTLSPLTLTPAGHEPPDSRVVLRLSPVGRVAASLRRGLWNDPSAPVELFGLSDLGSVVASFGGCPVYGGEFFDAHVSALAKWQGKYSFDAVIGTGALSHSLSLFQAGGTERHLDLCIWFDTLEVSDISGAAIASADLIAASQRWWQAFGRNDSGTRGHGMFSIR